GCPIRESPDKCRGGSRSSKPFAAARIEITQKIRLRSQRRMPAQAGIRIHGLPDSRFHGNDYERLSSAADGEPVDAQGRQTDADRHALAFLAARADAAIERHVVA